MWRMRLKEINRSNGPILKWLAISYLTFGVFLLVVSIDPVIVGDGSDRWAVVEALLIGSKIPPIKYSIIQPILSLPLAYVGPLVGVTSFQSVAYFNILIIAILGGVIVWRVRSIYGYEVAFIFSVLLLGASMLPHHGQFYLSEVSTAMFCFLGLILLDHSRKIAFVLLFLGIANNPVISPLLLVCLMERRWRPVIILILISVVLWVAFENWVKFGSLLGSPYFSEGEKGYKTIMPYSGLAGFSYPLVFGVLSIVVSFGKGLIFSFPV